MNIGYLSLAYEALSEIFQEKLPVKTAYTIHKVMEPIRAELNNLESMRLKLIDKHTTDGEINKEAFIRDYNELMETDTPLTLSGIPIKEILDSDVKISPTSLNILISIGVLTED